MEILENLAISASRASFRRRAFLSLALGQAALAARSAARFLAPIPLETLAVAHPAFRRDAFRRRR